MYKWGQSFHGCGALITNPMIGIQFQPELSCFSFIFWEVPVEKDTRVKHSWWPLGSKLFQGRQEWGSVELLAKYDVAALYIRLQKSVLEHLLFQPLNYFCLQIKHPPPFCQTHSCPSIGIGIDLETAGDPLLVVTGWCAAFFFVCLFLKQDLLLLAELAII